MNSLYKKIARVCWNKKNELVVTGGSGAQIKIKEYDHDKHAATIKNVMAEMKTVCQKWPLLAAENKSIFLGGEHEFLYDIHRNAWICGTINGPIVFDDETIEQFLMFLKNIQKYREI